MNKKKKIKNKDVKVTHVPHFEGLKVASMLQFASQYPNIQKYLPEIEREIDKLLRAYIANVIYTIVGEPFQTWIKRQIEVRNDKIKAE